MPTRRAARERALGLAYECEQRDVARPRAARRAARSRPTSTRADARASASTSTTTRSTRSSGSSPSTGRSSACRSSTARCCASARYELGWLPDVPTAVVITEAVELAKQYSTKDSGRFVNGLLVADRGGSPPRGDVDLMRRRWRRRSGPRRSSFPTRSRSCSARTDDDRDVPWIVHRVERPGQPHELRRLRVPEAVRLPAGEGDAADAPGAQRRQGGRGATAPREKCEVDVARLHAHGLWATMQHDTERGVRVVSARTTRRLRVVLDGSRSGCGCTTRGRRCCSGSSPISSACSRARRRRPVTKRLFPRAYLDPTEEAPESEWQSLVHGDLVDARRSRRWPSSCAGSHGGGDGRASGTVEVALDDEQPSTWLACLNDARLAFGTALGVTADDRPRRSTPTTRAPSYAGCTTGSPICAAGARRAALDESSRHRGRRLD